MASPLGQSSTTVGSGGMGYAPVPRVHDRQGQPEIPYSRWAPAGNATTSVRRRAGEGWRGRCRDQRQPPDRPLHPKCSSPRRPNTRAKRTLAAKDANRAET